MRFYLSLVLLLSFASCVAAQEVSLADAAKAARGAKARSKVVIDEENFRSMRGPIPEMNIEGVDNSDAIIKAMDEYRRSHNPQETEIAIREWYNHYDLMFQHAFEQSAEIRDRAQDRYPDPHPYPDDYRKYQEQRSTEIRSAIQDQRLIQKNGLLMARIQQCVQKVRGALYSFGLKYEWMKIRFGNGNGSW
jgi:hypothetical protein